MNFLTKKMRWNNVEFIPFKLCVASASLLLGAYFKEFVILYQNFIIGIFILTWIVIMYLWIKKMISS